MTFTDKEREIIITVAGERGSDPELKTWWDVMERLNYILERSNKTPRSYQQVYSDYLLTREGEGIKEEIQREKYKKMDVAREYRTDIRNQARIEVLNDRMEEAIRDLNHQYLPLPQYKTPEIDDARMIVSLSDLHYGANHKNYFSEYSTDILRQRLDAYSNYAIDYAKKYDVKEILVLNAGDAIEGNIHVSTRIQAECDAVTQSIEVAELIANFLYKVREETGVRVIYGSVLDNHSRIHPNKKDHIEKESFARIIDEFIRLRLVQMDVDIEMVGNYIDDNIGHYTLGGREIVWVHGHLDNPSNVYAKLSEMLDFKIDEVIIAHRHNVQMSWRVFQLPSCKGTDEYAKDKRLYSYAGQAIRIYEGKNRITLEVIF